VSIPGGFMAFCLRTGQNAFHPSEWTETERAAFHAWKLDAFKQKWSAYRKISIKTWCPKATIKSRIREDLDLLHAPPPSRPYRSCPCHSSAPRQAARDTAPHGLAWMASTFGRRR
jgi:hypothetical protein